MATTRRHHQPKRRGLTAAQQVAHDRAYDACNHTIHGRASKGDIIAARDGTTWKVMTYGIRYHEDVDSRLYGVQPCRPPKGWAETCELRRLIEDLRMSRIGTQDAGSWAGLGAQQPRPPGAVLATWRDGRAGSLATFPELTVYEGDVVGAWCPIYDDSPIVAWAQDPKLARRVIKLIAACPAPVQLPEMEVKERTIQLTIDEAHPRHAAYAATRGAHAEPPRESVLGPGHEYPGYLEIPRSEYRRVKAELDVAGVPNP